MSRPESYKVLTGKWCQCCRHVYELQHIDGGEEYFCQQDGVPRPMNYMEASFSEDDDAWNLWEEGRDVDPNGTCEEWDEAEEEPRMK